jgi:hypothetical protein
MQFPRNKQERTGGLDLEERKHVQRTTPQCSKRKVGAAIDS